MVPTLVLKADETVRWLTDASGKSTRAISRELGREGTFIGVYRSTGHLPSISLFCEIANACGFDVYLVRGDENIVVTPADDASA